MIAQALGAGFKATVQDSPKYYLIILYRNLLFQRHDGLIISSFFSSLVFYGISSSFHALIIQMNVLRGKISIEAIEQRKKQEWVGRMRDILYAQNAFMRKNQNEKKTFECCTNDHYCWLNQHSCCLLHSRIATRACVCTTGRLTTPNQPNKQTEQWKCNG